MDTDLTTIGGIIALTFTVLQGLKAWASETPYVKRVPMIGLAVVIGLGLSMLAIQAGFLHGSWKTIAAQTILAALGSSGLYTVVSGSASQSLQKAGGKSDGLAGLILLTVALGVSGCNFFTHVDPTTGLVVPDTQLQKYYKSKQIYVDVLKEISLYRDSGDISDKVADELFKPAMVVVDTAFNEWKAAIDLNSADVQQKQQAVVDAIAALNRLIIQFGGKSHGTSPVDPAGAA